MASTANLTKHKNGRASVRFAGPELDVDELVAEHHSRRLSSSREVLKVCLKRLLCCFSTREGPGVTGSRASLKELLDLCVGHTASLQGTQKNPRMSTMTFTQT